MRFKGLALMMLGIAVFGCAQEGAQQAQQMEMSASDMAAMETAMTAMRASWAEAYDAGDAAAVAELYATDAVYMLPYGDAVRGRAAIEQRLGETMAEMANRHVEITGNVEGMSGDLAYGTGGFTMSAEVMGEPYQDEGKFLVVMKRQADGSWKIQAHIWNTNLPQLMEGEKMEGEG